MAEPSVAGDGAISISTLEPNASDAELGEQPEPVSSVAAESGVEPQAETAAEMGQPEAAAPVEHGDTASPTAESAGEVTSPNGAVVEDADTQEYKVMPPSPFGPLTVPSSRPLPSDLPPMQSLDNLRRPASEAGAAAPTELPQAEPDQAEHEPAGAPADGLSWPLPVNIIVGGRYRVEGILSAAPDVSDAENVYRVRDLQGYERCWSCGAEHGAEAASDRFCSECGADMLAREYVLYERRLAVAVTEDAAPESALDDAPTQEMPVVGPNSGVGAARAERIFTQGQRMYRVVPRSIEPSPFPLGARVLIGATSDVGATRSGERNEDSIGIFVLNTAHDSHMQPLALGLVADGLGGHANGQDASRLVTRVVTDHILRNVSLPLIGLPVDASVPEEGLEAILREAVRSANLQLCKTNHESGVDMGSTLVAALIYEGTAHIVNAGDSRCYLMAGDELRRISTDHSLVEQLVASGMIEPNARYDHPQRNQIFKSLGDDPEMKADFFVQKLQPGMRLLLCSDGLWEMVRDPDIAQVLREAANPQDACNVLIHKANENGGEDNISVVVMEVRD
jgi:serine/threonine protein phosphatase PrpC